MTLCFGWSGKRESGEEGKLGRMAIAKDKIQGRTKP
jgi:hypothetical protein